MSGTDATRRVVTGFWDAMQTNDFTHAAEWLSKNVTISWPQSGEIIRGRPNFAALNTAYPVEGRWRFGIETMIYEGPCAVAIVTVSDDETSARVISLATVTEGLIASLVEWWPDPFPAPDWRERWVTQAASGS